MNDGKFIRFFQFTTNQCWTISRYNKGKYKITRVQSPHEYMK